MKKILNTIVTTMVVLSMVAGGFSVPSVAVASGNQTPGFTFPGFDFPDFDFPGIDFPGTGNNPPVVIRSCEINADIREVVSGGSVTLTWNTSGFDSVTINGQTVSGGNGSVVMSNITENTVYTLIATTADGNSECEAKVSIICLPPPPILNCELELIKSVNKANALIGDTLTYTIAVENKGTGDCTGGGVKITDVIDSKLTYLTQTTSANITPGYGNTPVYTEANRTLTFNAGTLTPGEKGTITVSVKVNQPTTCGDFEVQNKARVTAKELNNFNTWVDSNTVKTAINYDCPTPDPAPACDAFTASPSSIVVSGSAVLNWQTSNASRVVINNGIGEVALDGSITVSPLQTTTYKLTAFGTQNRTVDCEVPVTVTTVPAPVCESFTATPNQLGVGGGSVTLAWATNNASNVTIAPTIGSVAVDGNQVVNVTENTNFVLTASGVNGTSVTCAAPVTVATPTPVFTCENNVSFTASDTSIDEGDDTTLNWSTNNVDSVSISIIDATSLSGSRTVDPRRDTTYVLTARQGSNSIDCPLTINVDEDNGGGGGGGGGSATPRCELTISDNKIKAGDQITLRWDTSNATEVTIKDNRNNTVVTTEGKLSTDKRDLLDGSIRLRPTRDTEYTLTAERGSRDRTCKVKVEVEDLLVVRDQQPLVAGIALSNTPYTGFAAGPLLTFMFYALLIAWALFITYLIILRKRPAAAVITENENTVSNSIQRSVDARPDVFVASVNTNAPAKVVAPVNLPTGTPVIGYANMVASTNPHHVDNELINDLENRAHEQKALLSSDAVRHFIATTEGLVERNEALDEVIAKAKVSYPMEDGWIVINETRMKGLCETCLINEKSATETFIPAVVPTGSSSLAEAIVTGNVVAAYAMIGNRPMFALADAAADFDAVLRARKGEEVAISDLLAMETGLLSEEKIKNIIVALTGAIDGTYTDEAAAVKMAIMKAVKALV